MCGKTYEILTVDKAKKNKWERKQSIWVCNIQRTNIDYNIWPT